MTIVSGMGTVIGVQIAHPHECWLPDLPVAAWIVLTPGTRTRLRRF